MDKDQKYENEKDVRGNELHSSEQKLKDRSFPIELHQDNVIDSSDSKSLKDDNMKDDSSSNEATSLLNLQVSEPLNEQSEIKVAGSHKDVLTNNKLNIPPQYSDWKALAELDSLPLMKSGYSLEADMKFGWKPQIKGKVLPIPLVFDIEDELIQIDQFGPDKQKLPVLYQGWRPADSLKMHKKLLNSGNSSQMHGSDYPFKIPHDLPQSVQRLLDQQMQERVLGGKSFGAQRTSSHNVTNPDGSSNFEGMNPDLEIKQQVDQAKILSFDSTFESGNLDRVVMVTPKEYDMFMRLDTNSRGHHQWFYFKVNTKTNHGKVKFNILNFTKSRSLYEYGMKICVCSKRERDLHIENKRCNGDEESAGWKREGNNIEYKASKLNKIIEEKIKLEIQEGNTESNLQTMRRPKFYQLSFTYDFNSMAEDEVYFAYSFPYTFTRLTRFIKELKTKQETQKYFKDLTPLCNSLSGVDVPYLVVTTRANEKDYMKIEDSEHTSNSLPAMKQKQIVVLTGRVHPGETNASYMMEGFIKFITSPTDPVAIELRKRIVFRIVPCVNPDGVISGNYRVSMSGNDLNRRYQSPHPKLHPIVCAVKKIFKDINPSLEEEDNSVLAFIDMHGHSRKKNVFMYGPEYPIHDNRYLKIRIFPKLMSEKTQMFRFFSSKFRIQRSKEKTARVVLWREFNIMNCFTLEASFQGYFNHERETRDFLPHHFYDVGSTLAKTTFEYIMMKDEEQRVQKAKRLQKTQKQKAKIQQSNSNNRKNSEEKAKDNAKNRRNSSAGKAVLSPSASSEACIDDQQPLFQKNNKITKISKKLQQQSKAQGNSKAPTDPNQKKQKLRTAKKFKEDVPPLAPKKQKANPNMPDEEQQETQQDENTNKEGQQAHEKIDNFISQFTMKNRTFDQLFNQIKVEEEQEKQNEGDFSDSNNDDQEIKSQGGKSDKDSMGSDDDQNNLLLRKIHGKILDVVMKCEQATVGSNSAQPKNLKKIITSTSKEKTAKKKQITLYSTQKSEQTKKEDNKNTSKLSQVHSDYSKQKLTGQTGTLAQQILHQAKNKSSKNSKDTKLVQGSSLRRNDSHSAGLYNAQVIQQKRERAKHLSQHSQYHLSSSAHYSNIQQDINHEIIQTFQQQNLYNGPGIILQMNNNNFNDRIITQQYNKYKKNLFGSNPLQTLQNSNQIVQQKLRNENLFKDQNQQQPQFTFYNFQQRNQQQQQMQAQKDNEMPLIQQRLIANQQPESNMPVGMDIMKNNTQKMQSFRQQAQHNGNPVKVQTKDLNSYYQPNNGLRAARVSINTAMTTQIQSQSSLKDNNHVQFISGSPTATNPNENVGTSTKSAPRAGQPGINVVSASGFKRRNRKIVPHQNNTQVSMQPNIQTQNVCPEEVQIGSPAKPHPDKIPHITQQKLFGMQSLIEVAQRSMQNEYIQSIGNGHSSQIQERKSHNNSRLNTSQIPASAGHHSQKGESLVNHQHRALQKDQTILALQSQGGKKAQNISMIQYKQNHHNTQGKMHRNQNAITEGFHSEADQNNPQGLIGIKNINNNNKRSRGYDTAVKETRTKEFVMNMNDGKSDVTPQREQLRKQQTFQQQLPRHRAILVQGFAARVESTPQKEKETIFQAHKVQSQSFQQPTGLRSVQVRGQGMAQKSVKKNLTSEIQDLPHHEPYAEESKAKIDLKKQNERYIELHHSDKKSEFKEKYLGSLAQQQLIDKKSYQIKFLKSLEELDKHIEREIPPGQSAPQISENQSRLIISDNINIEVDNNE